MEQNPNNPTIRADRKTIEKNRRERMKVLYDTLWSLLPNHSSREAVVPVQDQVEGATQYIRNLEEKMEKMRRKKKWLVGGRAAPAVDKLLPVGGRVEVVGVESGVKVAVTTGVERHQLVFRETVRTVDEEGAEIVTAAYSVRDNLAFHTIHAQMDVSRAGDEVESAIARISRKLERIVVEGVCENSILIME